jgi:hypothetical protein
MTQIGHNSFDLRAPLGQEYSQHRPMAACFILAVAPDREIALMRKERQQIKRSADFWSSHLGSVFLDESSPQGGRTCNLPELHSFSARSEIRKPHVVPILRSELGLWHPPWRTTHSSDA